MNREEMETKLEEAAERLGVALTDFDAGKFESASVAVDEAFTHIDAVITALSDGNQDDADLNNYADVLEALGEASDWEQQDEDTRAATRQMIADTKTNLEQFEFSE